MLMETLEIRPRSVRNGLLLGAILIFALAGGVAALISGTPASMGLGAVVILVCGPVLFLVPKMMKRKVSMVLTAGALEYTGAWGTTQLPWADVEKFGLVDSNSTLAVGARLSSYDRYLASVSPEMAAKLLKLIPFVKVAGLAVTSVKMPYDQYTKIWSALSGKETLADQLKSFGKVGNYAEVILWNRQHYGYDLLWSWGDMDRSAKEFLVLLETYRKNAGSPAGN